MRDLTLHIGNMRDEGDLTIYIGDMSDEGVRMRGHTSHRRHEQRRRMRDTSFHIGDMNEEGVQMRGQILPIGDMSDTG